MCKLMDNSNHFHQTKIVHCTLRNFRVFLSGPNSFFSECLAVYRKIAKAIWRDSFVTLAMFPERRTYIGTRLLLHNICTLLPSNGIVFSFYSQTCPICLEDFREKEYVTVCPCKHGYHRQWVATPAMRICSHIWHEDKTLIVVNTTAAATLGTE